MKTIALLLLFMCVFSSELLGSAVGVDIQSLSEPEDEWLNYGRDYSEQRFSPQRQISPANVADLGLQWSYTFPTTRVMESTPLMHRGKLYVTTPWSRVFAFEARSGNLLWQYDPQVDKAHLINSCCGPANRGAALWTEGGKTQVFVGSFDGRLIALDADTGQVQWSVRTVPENSHYTVTGAPRVIGGKVIIGNGGAELGVRGYVSAYDTATGEMLWRFYTVPGNPEFPQESPELERALSTWNGEWWKFGGGGTAWDAMAYDPKLDLLYIGTGNGSPWNRDIRSPGGGDNLYLNSIVALRPGTGEYVWHYQVTPKDSWDYTATQHLILAELIIDGEETPVIMQAPKNGFFYVLDRRNGKLLSADAYAQINWASHVDLKTGRPVENPVADYNETGGSVIWPAPFGAHNWQPMAYSADTGLVYIPEQHVPGHYSPDKKFSFTRHRWNTGVDFWGMRFHPDPLIARATNDAILRGYLSAWDPIKKQKIWQVRHPTLSNGGVLATAGNLVFQGTGSGGFHAYDAKNGKRLWSFQTDSAVLAGPISYAIDGDQYIAVTQGAGGSVMLALGSDGETRRMNPNRLLVFKLKDSDSSSGTLPLVVQSELPTAIPTLEWSEMNSEELLKGEQLFERNCATCHGINVIAGNSVPDLRYLSAERHRDFQGIVLGGMLAHNGMVGFYETLDYQQVDLIHGYIVERNRLSREAQEKEGVWQKIRYQFWYWMAWLGDQFPWLANLTRDSFMGE